MGGSLVKQYVVGVTDHPFESLSVEREILEKANIKVIDLNVNTINELLQAGAFCHGLINTWVNINSNIIQKLVNCKIIARYGIGVDNIDLEAATKKGIYVTNVPSYGTEEVAVHAMSLLLAMARKLHIYSKTVSAGEWDYNVAAPIHRLSQQTLGLVGFGRIARTVAAKAQIFGLKILAYDPYVDPKIMAGANVKSVDKLESMLPYCDYLSLHVPLNEFTNQLLNSETLKLMMPSAVIINTSRGKVIDEEALFNALIEKRLAGAALDVLEEEPPLRENPLIRLENVLITPHTASYSEEAIISMRKTAAEQVVKALAGDVPEHIVNKDVIT